MLKRQYFFFNNSLVIDESLQCSTGFMVSEGEGLTQEKTVSVLRTFAVEILLSDSDRKAEI